MNDKPSRITTFIESNFKVNTRSVFYSLPLLINWVVGIIFEKDERAWKAARRSFFLACMFLAVNGILFFTNGFIGYFNKQIAQYIFFSLSVLNILVYLILSFRMVWKDWKESDFSEDMIEKKSLAFENFLSR